MTSWGYITKSGAILSDSNPQGHIANFDENGNIKGNIKTGLIIVKT